MELLVEVDCLRLRRRHGLRQLLLGEPVGATYVDAVAGSHSAEGVLRLPWMADLPNRDDVEGHPESPCDLGRDLDASPREADRDTIGDTLGLERIRQLAPCVGAVEEERLCEQPAFHLWPPIAARVCATSFPCRVPTAIGSEP